MLNWNSAKQIILKKNEDGTYNMTTLDDIFESDGITLKYKAECEYYKVQINKFDINVLLDEDRQKYCKIFKTK